MNNMEEIWDLVPGKCPENIIRSITDARTPHPGNHSESSFFQRLINYFFPSNKDYPLPNIPIYLLKKFY